MDYPADAKLPAREILAAKRHIFVCIGPDCCSENKGEEIWNLLKSETKNLPVLRTKAACLRVCKNGPWMVVYPEGIWYGALTEEKVRRILKEHIQDGVPVREWIAVEMPNLTSAR